MQPSYKTGKLPLVGTTSPLKLKGLSGRAFVKCSLALALFSCQPALAQEPSELHALIVALYEYDRGELLHYRKWKHGLTEEQCEQAKFDMMGQWLKSRDIRMVDEGLLRDYQMEQYYRFKCWPEAEVGGGNFKAWVGARVEVR